MENNGNLADDFDKKMNFRGKSMGGRGSGNWNRFESKTLAEDCLSIDIRQLNRMGGLEPWKRYNLTWKNGSNIIIKTKQEAIELSYTISRKGQQCKDVHVDVPLSWSACNYGGKRPWFICPGNGCGKRVAKLYLGGDRFLCRCCYDLVYSSQRKEKGFRMLDRAQKICYRLGASNFDDLIFESRPKPKGMHWSTYNELVNEAHKLNYEAMQIISKILKL